MNRIMPRVPNTTKTANSKTGDNATSRMADAIDKSNKSGKPVVFYEKSATIRKGDDYFRATVAVTSTTSLNDSDEVEIKKTFERLADIIEDEINYELGL